MVRVTQTGGFESNVDQVVARISLIHATTLAPFLTPVASLRHLLLKTRMFNSLGTFRIFQSDKFQNITVAKVTSSPSCLLYIFFL